MKKTNLVLAILMTACTVEMPTSLIDQTDLLATSLEVDHLICTADSLALDPIHKFVSNCGVTRKTHPGLAVSYGEA